jgi:hypothetical protein
MEEQKQNKVVSIVIESHLYLEDFNRLVEQLQKLEGFVFMIKSKTYTSESLKDEKVTIMSEDIYSDTYNLSKTMLNR